MARYASLSAAAALAERYLDAASGDERLVLRMQLVLERSAPPAPGAGPRYARLAEALQQAGDASGAVIARSFALVADNFGGDFAAALAAHERLLPEIHDLDDPLERHAALGPSLFLLQASGNTVGYMLQACRLLQLAEEIDHSGLRSAGLSNVGIAYFLAGDEPQARHHLEQSLESEEFGGWLRFSAVAILAEVYLASGALDKAVPLLQAWALPRNLAELDGPAMAHFHVLGAEVYIRLGEAQRAQACLDFVAAMPASPLNLDAPCTLAAVRALLQQRAGKLDQARVHLDEALSQAQQMPGGGAALGPRFWRLAAEVAGALGQWQQACQLQDRAWQRDLHRKQDVLAVRRSTMQLLTDTSVQAVESAQRDSLTGMATRERLITVGERWLAQRKPLLVAQLNLRRFKRINEALGHDTGDAVLRAVADRLREVCARFPQALASRVYADQFALVVAGGDDGLRVCAEVTAEMFGKPLAVGGHWVDISAAWGVVAPTVSGVGMQRLLSQAEIALTEDRRTQVGWTVFSPSLVRTDPRQLSLLSELKRAAQEDEFRLMLQPKFRLADDQVVSFESLVRWVHPVRGLVQPVDFIPFAESTAAIKGITAWVLQRAMRLSRSLEADGLVCEIAVNVSVHDVGDSGFVPLLQELLAATGARAQHIRLELTEGAVMRDPATVIDRMREVHAMGFEWSIDDFGTGQSSLAYLNLLPVSELKIDRSFVRGATASRASLTLLKAAIDLGRNLGLSTVGEGAETAEEWALLRELGCSLGQGWHGARPMAEDALRAWLRGARSG